MKSIIKIFLFIIAPVFMIECDYLEGVEYEHYGEDLRILEEDRFVFNRDDTLLYRCSDGSVDTVRIKNVTFYTSKTSDRSTDALGGTTVTIYHIDVQKVYIETFNNNWKKILQNVIDDFPDEDRNCYVITTDWQDPYDYPTTSVTFNCSGIVSGPAIIGVDITNLHQFLNKEYNRVYTSIFDDGTAIYWNLKYGIIRVVGVLDQVNLHWDLEGKI